MKLNQLFNLLAFVWLVCISLPAYAAMPPDYVKSPTTAAGHRALQARADCAAGRAPIDQDVNNVRARLLTGGDVWWNGTIGRYIVPKVGPGETEVSSLFAGAVWLGGFDEGGSLKMAAQQYGRSRDLFDYYPGPLNPEDGEVDRSTCSNWDKFFVVTAAEIREHQRLFAAALAGEGEYTDDMIPLGVKGWPARGNPYFQDVHNFPPPNTRQGLAGFYDYLDDEGNGAVDGVYDPLNGDLPIIEIEGCLDFYNPNENLRDDPQFPDQMIFWIYNDNGNTHTNSNSPTNLEMEVQVQAFAYSTNDALNNMTFQRYKLINRGKDPLTETFFGIWIDGDLGCANDDFIGCDTTRDLAIYYNQDPVDGDVGPVCEGGTPTYGDEPPIMGIDYFRGPGENRDTVIEINGELVDTSFRRELGMSSFTYFNRAGFGDPQATLDPTTGIPGEYYNLLSGLWRDGTPYTIGGTGYQSGGAITRYAFPSPPDVTGGDAWSMCSAGLGVGDRRTIQSSGPFTLLPDERNELIIGVPWLPDEETYPCPSLDRLLAADDLAQNLFDECFDITDGPDAPDVDIIELNRTLTLVLTNDEELSNNAFQRYAETDLLAPDGVEDSLYRFEGYKVYQLRNANVSLSELDDPTQARLIQQSDIKNGVTEIFNWNTVPNPNDPTRPVFEPEAQVLASDTDNGTQSVIRVTEDQFASGDDRRLVNHQPYYFTALAYAYNNYAEFDPFNPDAGGQRMAYLEGRRNVITYVGVPRPITDVRLTGDNKAAQVRRIDGVGTSSFFLDLAEGERERLLTPSDYQPVYAEGESPVVARVYNPFDSKDGIYSIEFRDDNYDLTAEERIDLRIGFDLEESGTWRMVSSTGDTIIQGQSYSELNEQVIGNLGVSIFLGQVEEPGVTLDDENGCIGYEVAVLEDGPEWFGAVQNKTRVPTAPELFNFMQTEDSEADFSVVYERDPNRGLTNCFDGEWIPMGLATYRSQLADPDRPQFGFITPTSISDGSRLLSEFDLEKLNNVDIVFTDDKSKWSRCIVVETANNSFNEIAGIGAVGDALQLQLRESPSVGLQFFDDGTAKPDNEIDDEGRDVIGKGWFPGYAIDTETGARLNIFFGENSAIKYPTTAIDTLLSPYLNYSDNADVAPVLTGADMMFNPTSDLFLQPLPGVPPPYPIWYAVAGGNHFVYVTREPYDECDRMYDLLRGNNQARRRAMNNVTYASLMLPRVPLKSYSEGLIPTETIVKLRVTNPYQVAEPVDDGRDADDLDDDRYVEFPTGENNGYPEYELTLAGVTAEDVPVTLGDSILSFVNVVPNPYYGFSSYEINEFSNIIRITNLPAQANITIYSLDGKFIREYRRNESTERPPVTNPEDPRTGNRAIEFRQVFPSLDWDLKNAQGIPVSSGVYLIHVDAFELGERTLKAFILQREFDPAGL